MKHVSAVSISKAVEEIDDTNNILENVFAFVLELVEAKGKVDIIA